jgi:thiol-disulfide isomerase/thioredoxin
MRPLMWVAVAALAAGPVSAADVELKVVKMAEFEQAIARHAGKVVVIDFWATFCVPCKKEFPNLVKLHQEYGKKGLVCMSVSVDTEDEKEDALKFLKEKGAAFENFLLADPPEVWQKTLKFDAVPVVFVYGKDGKIAKKFIADKPENVFDYGDVRKLVLPLLEK